MRTHNTQHRDPQALLRWAQRKLAEAERASVVNLQEKSNPLRSWSHRAKARDASMYVYAEVYKWQRLVRRYERECQTEVN